MRKIDEKKDITGMAAKTINFEKVVLQNLEEKAKKQGTNVSRMVNAFCRRIVLSDSEYYRELKKEAYIEFLRVQYMEDQANIKLEVE